MINYSCFCRMNFCLNLKSFTEKGQSLNTQMFGKCACWKKVKVLDKSGTASKSVFLCAYLHAEVQSGVRVVPVAAEKPDRAWPPSFCQLFHGKLSWQSRTSKHVKAGSPWLHSQPCHSSRSFLPSQTHATSCGFQWISQVVWLVFTAVLSPTVDSASPHSLALLPHAPCRTFCHLRNRNKKRKLSPICVDFVTCRDSLTTRRRPGFRTFHIQHHARECNTVDEAFRLDGPRLDGLSGLWPQNGLGSWLNVAHDLKAHGWDQLQHTHITHDQVASPKIRLSFFKRCQCWNNLSITLFFTSPSW